ncbi:MAG: TOBE domain-containing protein, partial [Acidimicrobiia bacterium]
LITVHPRAVSLYVDRPQGSPRNTWPTVIEAVEPLGDTTRIFLADPLPIAVDITPGATAALGLVPGVAVWASVKATEVNVTAVS